MGEKRGDVDILMSIFLFILRLAAVYHYFSESKEQFLSFDHCFSHSQNEREITHTDTHACAHACRASLSDSSLGSSIIPEFMSLGSSMASGFSNKQSGNVLHQSSK